MRRTKLTLIIGTNGTGKTTLSQQLIRHYLKTRDRVLIVSPHDYEWEDVKLLDRSKIHSYKGIRKEIFEKDTIKFITKNFYDGLLVLDDCRGYLKSNTDDDLHLLLIARRQQMLDIVAIAHGFTDVPPKLFTFATDYLLFKTLDNIEKRKKDLLNFDLMLASQKEVNREAETNPYYRKWISVIDTKISQ